MSCASKSFYVGGIKTNLAWAVIDGQQTRVVPGPAESGPDEWYGFPEVSVRELAEQRWSGELELPNASGHVEGERLLIPFDPDAIHGRAGRAAFGASLAANPRAVLHVRADSLKDGDKAGYTEKIALTTLALALTEGLPAGSGVQHQMVDLARHCPQTMAKLLKQHPEADDWVRGDDVPTSSRRWWG
jgi:hypothetical protein